MQEVVEASYNGIMQSVNDIISQGLMNKGPSNPVSIELQDKVKEMKLEFPGMSALEETSLLAVLSSVLTEGRSELDRMAVIAQNFDDSASEKLLEQYPHASTTGKDSVEILTALANPLERNTDKEDLPKTLQEKYLASKRKKHWLHVDSENVAPMPMRMGTHDPQRSLIVSSIKDAAKYALRVTTKNGTVADFDPDDLLNNLIIGLLGYWTDTGLNFDDKFNPKEACPVLRCEVLKSEIN